MTAGPDAGEGRIVVGVDGSAHSEQALRWGAHFAAILGARLEAVIAWEFPSSYGWASVPPEWNPGKDMEKVLDVEVDHSPSRLRASAYLGSSSSSTWSSNSDRLWFSMYSLMACRATSCMERCSSSERRRRASDSLSASLSVIAIGSQGRGA